MCVAILVIEGKSLGEQNSVVDALPLDLGGEIDIFERARGRKKKKKEKPKKTPKKKCYPINRLCILNETCWRVS